MLTAIVQPDLLTVREKNPLGEKPSIYGDYGDEWEYTEALTKWQQAEQSLRTWEIDEESLYMENIKFHSGIRELTAGQEVQGEIRNGKFWIS